MQFPTLFSWLSASYVSFTRTRRPRNLQEGAMRLCLVGLQFRRCSPGASRAPPQRRAMRVTGVTEAEACTAPTFTVPAAAIGACARATASTAVTGLRLIRDITRAMAGMDKLIAGGGGRERLPQRSCRSPPPPHRSTTPTFRLAAIALRRRRLASCIRRPTRSGLLLRGAGRTCAWRRGVTTRNGENV